MREMSDVRSDTCLQHHRRTTLDARPSEMRTCAKCGGIDGVPRVNIGVTVAWMAGVTLAIGGVLAALMELVIG
jgi:hypothetical protein